MNGLKKAPSFQRNAEGLHICFALILSARRPFEEEGKNAALMDWSNVEVKSHPVQYNIFQQTLLWVTEADLQTDCSLVNGFKAMVEQLKWVTDKNVSPDTVEMRINGREEVSILTNLYVPREDSL